MDKHNHLPLDAYRLNTYQVFTGLSPDLHRFHSFGAYGWTTATGIMKFLAVCAFYAPYLRVPNHAHVTVAPDQTNGTLGLPITAPDTTTEAALSLCECRRHPDAASCGAAYNAEVLRYARDL
eukprot:IDg12201t1